MWYRTISRLQQINQAYDEVIKETPCKYKPYLPKAYYINEIAIKTNLSHNLIQEALSKYNKKKMAEAVNYF